MINNYTKEELSKIVAESFSFVEVLSKLGYSTKGGNNNTTLKNRLEYYGISTEHFTHKPSKRNWSDEEIFCEDSKASQPTLRRAYKNKTIDSYKCAVCGLEPFWNGKPLVLTLDHKNGKNRDNRYENLRWICPNCDRQSDTYGMKNKKNLQKNVILFSSSNAEIEPKIDSKKSIKIEAPNRQELKDKLWSFKNYTQVANHYNVSPTQIRRWCRQYDLPATINIVKHTSEIGWKTENWNDSYKPNNLVIEQSLSCYMLDKNTEEIIREFPSRAEAVRYLGITSKGAATHISAVCNGTRETAYGYKWKDAK